MIETIPLISVHGNVKIETFDWRTGKKKAETEGHNLFTNYGLEAFRQMCALAIGGQFGGNIYFDEDAYPISLYNNTTFGFMKYLILTDNSSAVSATNRLIPGTLTGYASRDTYSGSDVKRGVINRNESALSRTGLKAVFDFATDRANGTHKSVFWSDYAPGSSGIYNIYETDAYPSVKLARGYTQLVEADDGYIYGSVGTTLYKIDPDTLEELSTYTLPATPDSSAIFDVYEGVCYFATSNSSTTLYAYTISTGSSTTKTLPVAGYSSGGCVISGYLYYPYRSSGTYRIYKYDLSAGTSTYNEGSYFTYARRLGSNLYLHNTQDAVYAYDYGTNVLTATGMPYSSYIRNTYSLASRFYCQVGNTAYYDASANTTSYALRQMSASATASNMITGKLLDSPVVKTSDQTMKVTYTITFT